MDTDVKRRGLFLYFKQIERLESRLSGSEHWLLFQRPPYGALEPPVPLAPGQLHLCLFIMCVCMHTHTHSLK